MIEVTKKVGDTSFEDLGGKKVGDAVPVRTGDPISLTNLGGKIVLPHNAHPEADSQDSKDEAAASD